MRHVAHSISVDAGMIMVADVAYLNDHPCKDSPLKTGKVFDVPTGTYNVHWSIADTWNGPIEGDAILQVTSGKVFVSDPCYLIGPEHSQWTDWLHKTDFGNALNDNRAFIIDEMGGDGSYEVELEFEQ